MTKAEFENMFLVFGMLDKEKQDKFIKDYVYSKVKPLVERAIKGEIDLNKLKEALNNFNNETEELRKELEQENCND